MRSRREMRNSRIWARLSMTTTVGARTAAKEVLALPGTAGTARDDGWHVDWMT
jgi:hypothetical protein